MAHAVCTGRLQVGTGGRHRQLAQAVGHIPAHGRIAPFRRVVPFRRVAQAAKQIVKARKPQSCALFTFRNQSSAPGCQQFCSQLPAILLPVARHSASRGSPSAPAGPAFCLRWPAILLPVVRHSASGCPQFYFRCPGLSSHSAFHVPKGSLSPSLFCFSVPNVQYYVTKAHYYHIQANIPGNSRTKTSILCSGSQKTRVPDPKSAQKPRFCARGDWDWHREER